MNVLERAIQTDTVPSRQARNFYRPELDALRLFAFLGVFLFHSPRGPSSKYQFFAHGFGAALPLFFLLSAYLITELLIRERSRTGDIQLKAFYFRRILRIWPLYFLGVGLAIASSALFPEQFHLNHHQMAYLLLFAGWLDGSFNGNPFGQLWSISVEEVFYLLWPSLFKWGNRQSLLAALGSTVLAALYFAGWHYAWYDPRPQFLFFASGTLLALWLHAHPVTVPGSIRFLLFVAGLTLWGFGTPVAGPAPAPPRAITNFTAMDLGCIAIFLAFYGLSRSSFPQWLLYLGRISYGLYVFHVAWIKGIALAADQLGMHQDRWPCALLVIAISLAGTIGTAALSHRYFEQPFLTLKSRYQVVKAGKL